MTHIQDTSAKLEDRGRQCMFVGYQDNLSGDCYRMWYPAMNIILMTRDIIWLHSIYFKKRAAKIRMIKKSTKYKVQSGEVTEKNVKLTPRAHHAAQ